LWPAIGRISSAIVADALGLHAERMFTLCPTPDGLSTLIVSQETQRGRFRGWAAYTRPVACGRANEAMFADLPEPSAMVRLHRAPPAGGMPIPPSRGTAIP
jgi:hypothetical protein